MAERILDARYQRAAQHGHAQGVAGQPAAPLVSMIGAWAALIDHRDGGFLVAAASSALLPQVSVTVPPDTPGDPTRSQGVEPYARGAKRCYLDPLPRYRPEVNAQGQMGVSMLDLFTQPPVRYWTARLDVEFRMVCPQTAAASSSAAGSAATGAV